MFRFSFFVYRFRLFSLLSLPRYARFARFARSRAARAQRTERAQKLIEPSKPEVFQFFSDLQTHPDTIQNIPQNLPNFIPKPSKIHPISLPKSLPKRILRGSGRVLGALWQSTLNFNEFLLSFDPLGLPLGPHVDPKLRLCWTSGGFLPALGRSWAATWPPGTPKKPR